MSEFPLQSVEICTFSQMPNHECLMLFEFPCYWSNGSYDAVSTRGSYPFEEAAEHQARYSSIWNDWRHPSFGKYI